MFLPESWEKRPVVRLFDRALYYFILTGISLAVMHFSLDASQAVKMGVAFIAACIGGVLGVNGKGRRKA